MLKMSLSHALRASQISIVKSNTFEREESRKPISLRGKKLWFSDGIWHRLAGHYLHPSIIYINFLLLLFNPNFKGNTDFAACFSFRVFLVKIDRELQYWNFYRNFIEKLYDCSRSTGGEGWGDSRENIVYNKVILRRVWSSAISYLFSC